MENPAQLRDWLRETMLLDTTELSKKHPGIFIAGSDVVEQTLREYEMQMMLTLELSLPCGHWKKNTELKIKDPVQKSTKKRLKRLIGRMSLIMNTSKEQSKSVSFYLESELVRMYVSISQKIAKHTHTHLRTSRQVRKYAPPYTSFLVPSTGDRGT
mgnify:CR=1 FL=1